MIVTKLTFYFGTMSSLVYRLSLIYSLVPCDLEHLSIFDVRMIFPMFVIDDR